MPKLLSQLCFFVLFVFFTTTFAYPSNHQPAHEPYEPETDPLPSENKATTLDSSHSLSKRNAPSLTIYRSDCTRPIRNVEFGVGRHHGAAISTREIGGDAFAIRGDCPNGYFRITFEHKTEKGKNYRGPYDIWPEHVGTCQAPTLGMGERVYVQCIVHEKGNSEPEN